MKKILTALLCFCVGLVWSQNVANGFEKIPGPAFGDVKPYYTIKGDTVYGRHDDELYSSYDAGLSWNAMQVKFNGLDITASVVVGSTGKFFYTEQDTLNQYPPVYRLYASSDEGLNWHLTGSTLIPVRALDLQETYNGVLLGIAQTTPKIYRSEDGGATWSLVLTASNEFFYDINIYSNHRVLLTGYSGNSNYSSNDDGATWTKLANPTLEKLWWSNTGTFLAVQQTTNQLSMLLRSDDNGTSWDTIPGFGTPSAPLSKKNEINSMMFLPTGNILATRAQVDSLIISSDDGLSWQPLSSRISFNTFSLYHPLSNGQLLATNGYRSDDGGTTWSVSAEGLNYAQVSALQLINDTTLFASVKLGLWRTLNGQDWEKVNDRVIKYTVGHLNSLVLAKAITTPTETTYKLLYSNNLGSSFSDITPSTGVWNYYEHVGISPGDSLLFTSVNYGGQSKLCRSIDQGQTWEPVADDVILQDMAYHPSGRYYALCANSDYLISKLLYSDDFGRSWQQMPQAAEGIAGETQLFISQNGNIMLIANNLMEMPYAIRSTDNGASWSLLPVLPNDASQFTNAVENVQGHIIALTDDWFYRSTDGGYTWQRSELPLWLYTNDLILSKGQYLYITTTGQGIFRSSNPTTEGAYIRGAVLQDADADCSTDDAQTSDLNNWDIVASGMSDYFATTDSLGRYNFFVDTGYYQVSVVTPQAYWWVFCGDTTETTYLPDIMGADTINFVATALSDCPLITVNVAAPMLRRCFDNQVYVQYCNQGTEPADSAWIDVSLDPYLIFIGSAQAHEDLGNNVLRFFLGDVDNGDCGQFQLTVNVDCNTAILGQTHCISAHGFPDTLCTTVPDWSGANLEATVSCQDTVVTFILENTGSAPSQTLDYIIIEDDVVMWQGSGQYDPNESMSIPVPANGHTYRLESEQEPGHPFSYRVIAFEEGCGGYESLGYINQFSVNGETPSVHQICVENTGSYDPNDKRGYPIGTGTEHLIRPGQSIEYMIRFQNTGTDTAFTVVVIDSLPQWLNPASLTPGAASHAYTWAISGPGIVRFTFNNILLPDSTTNLAGSQGFVTFNIAQQPDVPLGTQIRNDAAIFFDFNAPVITNETLHTVGVDLISSTVDIPNQAKPAAVTLSPNPALDHTTFQLRKGNFDEHRLQLFDPLGKPVFDTEVNGAQFVMPRGHLPAGAYGWRVTDHRGLLLESGVVVFE